jgi:hypothetical protein
MVARDGIVPHPVSESTQLAENSFPLIVQNGQFGSSLAQFWHKSLG